MHDWTEYARTRFAFLAATVLVVACDDAGSPARSVSVIGAASISSPSADTVGGVGTLGLGSPTPGSDRQEFNFDVSANLAGGQLFYRDWSVVRSDGTVGTVTVDPTDPSTAITAYRDWASACTNPTRGVAFDGIGRLDTGSLVSFTVTTCDNGTPGTGTDFLQMDVPTLTYSHGGLLTSGDFAKMGTATIVLQDGFEDGLSAWTQDPANARYSVSSDPARVHSGTYSLQSLFDPTNAYGVLSRWFMPGYDDVYVEFYVMFQEGFENQRPDGNGMHFLTMCGDNINDPKSCWGKAGIRPSGTDYFYAGVDPEEVNLPSLQPLSFYTYWPDMSCPPLYPVDPCFGNVLTQSSPKIPLVGGQWQQVVFHIKMNTPSQSDGSQELWVNGQQKIAQQSMRWRTTTDLHVNNIRFDNYMDKSPQTEYLWIDDVTVWRE